MRLLFVRILASATLVLTSVAVAAFDRLGFFSTIFLIGAVAIGCLTYLLFSRPPKVATEGATAPLSLPTKKRLKRIMATLFFVLTAASLITLTSLDFGKSPSYFVATAAGASVLALYIGLVDTRKEAAAGILMVLVLAANLFGSSQLVFPLGIGGADSPTHIDFLVRPIVQSGAIPHSEQCGLIYDDFPAHHVLVATGSLMIASDPARVYYGLGALVMLVPVLVLFLIGRSLFGTRTGLLGALLLSGGSYFISWASHAAPLTFALPAMATLLLVALRLLDTFRAKLLVPAGLLGLVIILTHPYSSAIIGLGLAGLAVGQALIRGTSRVPRWGPAVIAVLFGYTLLIDWTNLPCMLGTSLRLGRGYYQTITEEPLVSGTGVYDTLPLSTIFVNTLGDSILLSLAVFGFFVVASRGFSPRIMQVIGPTFALLSLSIVGLVSSLDYILPNRIYVYLQFVGFAPLAAVGVVRLVLGERDAPTRRKQWARLLISTAIAAAFVFASASSTIAGFETSLFTAGEPFVKLYNTESEIEAADWICVHSATTFVVRTSPSMHGLSRHVIRRCLAINGGLEEGLSVVNGAFSVQFLEPKTLVVFSYYDLDPGFQSGVTGAGKLGQGVYERLDEDALSVFSAYDKLYDNGRMEIYSVPP